MVVLPQENKVNNDCFRLICLCVCKERSKKWVPRQNLCGISTSLLRLRENCVMVRLVICRWLGIYSSAEVQSIDCIIPRIFIAVAKPLMRHNPRLGLSSAAFLFRRKRPIITLCKSAFYTQTIYQIPG